jgi:hypothetical protein
MANTVNSLSYANTFGDWVVTTNELVTEIDSLGFGNYTKQSGTLYLNSPTLGLQVANNAIVAGQLAVQGIGSTAYVQNSLTVGGTAFIGYTSVNTATVNTSTVGVINVTGSGSALTVSNNAALGSATIGSLALTGSGTVSGNLTVGGATIYSSNAGVWPISITGNATSVSNGVYTSVTYANPSWITSLANTKITGLITSSQIATIANTQITGVITANQIAGGAVVNSITGTSKQVSANASSGNILLSLPQNVDTTANVQFNSLGVGVAANNNTGEILAANNITAYYSDDRLKDRIENIPNAVEKVQTLNGFYYRANQVAQSLGYSDKLEVGLSAQEVQKILPEIIAPAPIDNQYMTIHYERVIPLLVEAIKELKAEIDTLKGN